jgi:hypothetical protein
VKQRQTVTAALLLSSFAIACSSTSSSAPSVQNAGNGVDDVMQACAIRAAWQQTLTPACTTCFAETPAQACSCDSDPDRAKCLEQSQAKAAEPDCSTALSDCTIACHNDCACVDACYVGHDACRKVAAAFDGCVAAVCDPSCR